MANHVQKDVDFEKEGGFEEKVAYDKKYYEEMKRHLKTRDIAEKHQTLLAALLRNCFGLKNVGIYCYESDIVFVFPEGVNLASASVQKLKKFLPRMIKVKGMQLHAPDGAYGDQGPQLIVSL